MKRIRDRLSLIIPFALLALLDGGVTLFFQPSSYWADHSAFVESNPLFAHMLSISPWLFLGAIITWILSLSIVITVTPRLLGLGFGTGLIYGHSVGALGWLRHFVFKTYWNNMIYYMFIAFLLIWAISDQIERRIKKSEQ